MQMLHLVKYSQKLKDFLQYTGSLKNVLLELIY